MAKIDSVIHYIVFNYALPAVIVFPVIIYLASGINMKKIEAIMLNRVCGMIHKRYFVTEKRSLFESLEELKKNCKGQFNILEIGVGSGMNFKYYPRGTFLSCVDPNPHHDKYWMKNLEANRGIHLVRSYVTGAENMPEVPSNTYDVVVCTLTLCSVRDPEAVLAEVRRVLKNNGTFFFLEHVAGGEGSITRRTQNMLQTIWPYFSGGCHLNRETWTYLDQSGFRTVQYTHFAIKSWLFFFIRPCLYGKAVK